MAEDYLTFAVWLAVIGAAALLAERLITKWLNGVMRRNEIPRNI